MAAKFIALTVLVGAWQVSGIKDNSAYSYSYGVADPKTGDVKSQSESLLGDRVVGQYSLLESDGTRCVVNYAADDLKGFNATVRKDPAYINATPIVAGAAPVVAASSPVIAFGPVIAAAAPVISAASPVVASTAALGLAVPLTYGYSNAFAAPLTRGYEYGSAISAPSTDVGIVAGAWGNDGRSGEWDNGATIGARGNGAGIGVWGSGRGLNGGISYLLK